MTKQKNPPQNNNRKTAFVVNDHRVLGGVKFKSFLIQTKEKEDENNGTTQRD